MTCYRDLHILTVGTYTYTTDQRFTTTHHKETDEWTLQIKFAQKRDAGLYDCQISTQPVKSYSVRLNLVSKYCDCHLRTKRRGDGKKIYKKNFLVHSSLTIKNCSSPQFPVKLW